MLLSSAHSQNILDIEIEMALSISIPDANPDVLGEVVTRCSIHGASGQAVFVAVVVEDGTADPDPCSWRNSVYAEHGASASEVTVHGAFRCKLDCRPSTGAIEFSFRLHTVPIKSMCGREFRIAAYADRHGRELLGLSKPFRNVVYKVRILEEPNLLKFPQPGEPYSFDVAEEPMVFKVGLTAGGSDRVVPDDATVLLDLMLVDAAGNSKTDLIKRTPEGMPCWWTIENDGAVVDNSDYTSLPVLLKCVIIDPICVPVAIRVSVESVENANFTSTDVGSCETPLFTTLCSGDTASPTGSSGQAVSCSAATGGLLLAAPELTSEIPLEYQGDSPKDKLMRWVHMAMVALQKSRTTTDLSNLDRELLFEVLSRYHLLGIEECVDMLEVVPPPFPPAVPGLVAGDSMTTSKSGSSLWSQDSEVVIGSVASANRN